jgi:hypothetical protein
MKNRLTWRKIIILGVLLVTPFALAQCGSSTEGESVSSSHVGPVGPTFPGKYFFDATMTPHTVMAKGTVTILLRAWDIDGNPAPGVSFITSGFIKEIDLDSLPTTGSGGYTYMVIEIPAGPANVSSLIFTVEDTSLSIALQVLANE